jgi:hypothetical protein
MRQSSAITSSKVCTQSLHPVLQRAFACSDIQLDEELVRYRRQKALGKATYSPRPAAYQKAAKSPDLMAIAPMSAASDSPLNSGASDTWLQPDPLEPETAPFNFAIAALSNPGDLSSQNSELKELAAQYAAQVANNADSSLDEISPDDYLESSEELLRSLAAEEAEVQAEQGFLKSLLTPLGMGSMLLLLLSSAMFGFLVMNPTSISHLFERKDTQTATHSLGASVPGPSDASGEMTSPPQPNLASREFPDLSLQTLGSVEATPSSALGVPSGQSGVSPVKNAQTANIGLSGSNAPNSPLQPSEPVTTTITTLKVAPPLPAAANSYPSGAPAPSLPTLAPEAPVPRASAPIPRYKPSAKPARSTPAQGSSPIQSYVPPVKTPPLPVQIDTQPSAMPPMEAPQAPVRVRESVKVVTPYSSDRSLDEARQKVPDAYLQNYPTGAKVQLGSFENEAAARARVEELRQQGVQAEIYKPEGIKPESKR